MLQELQGHVVHHARPDSREVQLGKTQRGQPMVLYRGFAYYGTRKAKRGYHHWYCVSRNFGRCRANIYTTQDLRITNVFDLHTHGPPSFYRNSRGEFVKVRQDRYP
ncbi:hypothetical protein EVAR_9195_1 [Eumeta japonica]|uniref:FLYWCH-type domain-containing protein n=1 Tax=Eumeta variegata TaxID=151549 RepID=A0A4C1WMN8_EUMVA|nr:hypothetical protein EVAR_9195_1 [Eumeta japonica]